MNPVWRRWLLRRPSSPVRRLNVQRLEARTVPAVYAVTAAADVVDAGGGVLSLREAVLAANANPGADLVDVPAGTFALSLAGAA